MHDITQIGPPQFPVPQPPGARDALRRRRRVLLPPQLAAYRHPTRQRLPQPPAPEQIARLLDPALTLARAKRLAAAIIAANDRHDYGAAWDAADEALTYPFRKAIPSSC